MKRIFFYCEKTFEILFWIIAWAISPFFFYYLSPLIAISFLVAWIKFRDREAKYLFAGSSLIAVIMLMWEGGFYVVTTRKYFLTCIFSTLIISLYASFVARGPEKSRERQVFRRVNAFCVRVWHENKIALSLISASGIGVSLAFLYFFNKGYSYSEECILDKIKDAKTAAAAQMVRSSCAALYPKKSSQNYFDKFDK